MLGFVEDPFGDTKGFDSSRDAAIDGDLHQHILELFLGQPVGDGAAKMQFKFVRTAK